jgi:hypothetical protein
MSEQDVSMSFACDHNVQASEMTCTVAMSGGDQDLETPQTAVLKGDEISFNVATVVAGASLLNAAQASATPAAAASSGSVVATPAASAQSGLKTAAASASATGTGVQAMGNMTHSATGSAAVAEHTGAAAKFGLGAGALAMFVGAVAAL